MSTADESSSGAQTTPCWPPAAPTPAFTRHISQAPEAGLDIILAVDRPTLEQLDRAALTACAGLTAQGSVTVVALNTHDRTTDAPEPMGLDTTLVFSLEHLALGIFPAIDGARSTSTLDVSDTATATKRRLAEAAALRAWFSQPMYVAADHTGEDGTWLEPDAVEAELRALAR